MTRTCLKTGGKWSCQRCCMLWDPWSASQLCFSFGVEYLFLFSRRAMTGTSFPSCLLSSGPVLLRCFVRRKVLELVEANPSYAAVRFSDGRESSISTSDLAPLPESPVGLVDTPPRGIFGDVLCHQTELSPDTMDPDSVADGNFNRRRLIAPHRLPEMCLSTVPLEFVDHRRDMGQYYLVVQLVQYFSLVNVAHFSVALRASLLLAVPSRWSSNYVSRVASSVLLVQPVLCHSFLRLWSSA